MLTGKLTDGFLKSTKLGRKEKEINNSAQCITTQTKRSCFQLRQWKLDHFLPSIIFSSTKMEIHAGHEPVGVTFNPEQVPAMLRFDAVYWVRKTIPEVKHRYWDALLSSV